MAIYESLCLICRKRHEYVSSISMCHITPTCCGQPTEKRIFSAAMGIVDIPAYVSPVSGKWINSRAQRRDDLKRTGCRPWEGKEQELKEAKRQEAYMDQAQDAALEHTIRRSLADLSPRKKDLLLKSA